MRIGIYLGRHAGAGGGMAVYARALIIHALELLEGQQHRDDELVLYSDRTVIDEALLEFLHLSPVLTAEARLPLDTGAGVYFRKLPNGARCRVLIRFLPQILGRRLGYFLDQLLIPLYVALDRPDVLHSAANLGAPLSRTRQVITVHDLYQAWPIGGENERSLIKALFRSAYRSLFRGQFKKAQHLITDCKSVADEIVERFRLDRARISVIPLGLDRVFQRYVMLSEEPARQEELKKRWRDTIKVEPGYTVILASADPRKNLANTIEAWKALGAADRSRGLIVVRSDSVSSRMVKNLLGDAYDDEKVKVLDRLERSDLPFLFANSSVLLAPTLAEGFGYPALEALACGASVVSADLEFLHGMDTEKVFVCDPKLVSSITQSLTLALTPVALPKIEKNRFRTMADVVAATFLVYKEVVLRYNKLR